MKAVGSAIPTFRVYVVEDSRVLLPRLIDLLANLPGASIVGHSGRAEIAVAEIAARRPAAIILDLKLENGTGYDVLREIARLNVAAIPIVLTNYTTPLYRSEAARLGAAYFFDKSSEIPQMVRAVEALIERHRKQLLEEANGTDSGRKRDDYGSNGGTGL